MRARRLLKRAPGVTIDEWRTSMGYKTILVQLAGEDAFEGVLKPALNLAQRFGAHVIGLAVTPPFIFTPTFLPGRSAAVDDRYRKTFAEEAARLKPRFEGAARDAGVSAQWVDEDAGLLPAWRRVVAHGRMVDLIVTPAPRNDGAEQIVLQAGRPVLFVPDDASRPIGKRVTIAWNGRREGTRAAFDALPLLIGAQAVKVLWINPEDDGEGESVPMEDFCAALARHGVPAEAVELKAPDEKVSETLNRFLKDTDSDLLVMGCYGHSRLREMVLGGATRRILAAPPLPVLMSH